MALDFFAGCLGGCAGVLIGHPLDTVKVRLQTQDSNRIIYRGTYHCITSIIQNESVQGLFKGMSSPMCGLAAVNALVFGTYGNLQRAAPNPNALTSHAMAGSTAGIVQSIITSPMELAKSRMQLQGQETMKKVTPYWDKNKVLYKSPLDCLRKVAKSEGYRGIFRGLWCTILRDSPAFAAYFCGFEYMTQKLSNDKCQISNASLLLAGGMAGIISWVLVYPVDVIKSRLQCDGMEGARKYNGICDCIKKSYQNEGMKVFFRGLPSTILRAFPTNAATFAVFTWVFMLCESSSQIDKRELEELKKDSEIENKICRTALLMDSYS